MIPPFDIFQADNAGLLWVEAAPSLDEAKAKVQKLMEQRPAKFVIFSQRTGNRIVLRPGDSEWSSGGKKEE